MKFVTRIVEELMEIWLNKVCDNDILEYKSTTIYSVRRIESSNYSGDK